MRNKYICIATEIEKYKSQPEQLCMYVAFPQFSKLCLHPKMHSASIFNTKLLKGTIKMETGSLIDISFLLYLHLYIFYVIRNWYIGNFWIPL